MRLFLLLARCASMLVLGELLAGCSISGKQQNVPLVSPVRPHVRFNATSHVGIWVSSSQGYLFGQNEVGRKTVTAIDVTPYDCTPHGIKVDHQQNLWVACEADDGKSTIEEYAPGSSAPSTTYADSGCASCYLFYGWPYDVAFDDAGHVFAANIYSIYCTSKSSCSSSSGEVVWWNANAPTAPPTLIYDPNITIVQYLDADPLGNLYIDGQGCLSAHDCGFIVDEIANPTTAPTITNLIPPGILGKHVAGVYVSKSGEVLDVIDQDARTTFQYALPWVASEQPFNVLGPTFQNKFGLGAPVSGGFNEGDTRQVIADFNGWLDVGRVASNKYSAVSNPNFDSIASAAYVPSDK